MRQIEYECTLVARELLNQENIFLTFESQAIADQAKPGQFIDIKGPAFLRRPLGIASVDRKKGNFSLGIKRKNFGTAAFFDAGIGDVFSVLGPLGNGFNLEGLKSIFLIGGGTGIYPLLYVLEAAQELSINTYIAMGFRTDQDILLESQMRSLATDLYLATEDGSAHIKGFAQNALEKLWSDFSFELSDNKNHYLAETALFSCGPLPMMRKSAEWAKSIGLACQVSMEERMACGIGICRTCAVAVKSKDGKTIDYDRCCIEGPVFSGEVIEW